MGLGNTRSPASNTHPGSWTQHHNIRTSSQSMNTTHFTCYKQTGSKFSTLYTIWLSLVHLQLDSAVTGTRAGVIRKPLLTPHLYCYNTHGMYTSSTWRLYEARVRCLNWRILVITCTITHCTCPLDSDFFLWPVWGLLARQAATQPRNLLAPCWLQNTDVSHLLMTTTSGCHL